MTPGEAWREGKPLPDEVLRFLAGQLRGNVRELEGRTAQRRHYSRVTGRAVDVPLVREALADLLRHAVRVVQLADIDGRSAGCCGWSTACCSRRAGPGR